MVAWSAWAAVVSSVMEAAWLSTLLVRSVMVAASVSDWLSSASMRDWASLMAASAAF